VRKITGLSLLSFAAAVLLLAVMLLYLSYPAPAYVAALAALCGFLIAATLFTALMVRRLSGLIASLEEKARRLNDIIGNLPNPVVELDCNGTVLHMNRPGLELTGQNGSDVVNMAFTELFETGARNAATAFVEGVMKGGITEPAELPFIMKDGKTGVFEFIPIPLRRDGAIGGCLMLGVDMEERRRMSVELARAREEAEERSGELRKTITDLEEFALIAVRREMKMQEIRERFHRLKDEHKLTRDLPG